MRSLFVVTAALLSAATPFVWASTALAAPAHTATPPGDQRPARRSATPVRPARVIVRPGDSLSIISARVYGRQAAWPLLYYANRSKIRWANQIETGWVLKVPARRHHIPLAPAILGPPPPAVRARTPSVPIPPPAREVQPIPPAAQAPPPHSRAVTYAPAQAPATGGSFQQCVIARESGGNSQAMNASGHYGLYQFAASTWAAYGGNPASFGNASAAEQTQVFNNAIAAGGSSNWSPYDGC